MFDLSDIEFRTRRRDLLVVQQEVVALNFLTLPLGLDVGPVDEDVVLDAGLEPPSLPSFRKVTGTCRTETERVSIALLGKGSRH